MRASLEGTIWLDLNSSGAVDDSDRAVPSAMVWLDTNGNGRPDDAEPQTISDAAGSYRFENLAAGDYQVRMQPTPGLIQSAPKEYFAFHHDTASQLFGLARIDMVTGEVTSMTPASDGLRHGVIKTNAGEYFGAGQSTDSLFRIDPITGRQVKIGSTGKEIAAGLAYDPIMDKIYTLASDDTTDLQPVYLYEVNRETAQLTRVGDGEGLSKPFTTTSLTFDWVRREVVQFDNARNELIAYDLTGRTRTITRLPNDVLFFNLAFDGSRFLTFHPTDEITTLYAIDTALGQLVPLRTLTGPKLAVDSADIAMGGQALSVRLADASTTASQVDFLTERWNSSDATLEITDQALHLVSDLQQVDLVQDISNSTQPVLFCSGTAASHLTVVNHLTSDRAVDLLMSDQDDLLSIDQIGDLSIDMGAGLDTLQPSQAMHIDLPQSASQLKGIDRIDLTQFLGSTIRINSTSVADITDAGKLILRTAAGNQLQLSSEAWRAESPSVIAGERVHSLAVNDVVLEVATDLAWQNPLVAEDVNRDGSISAIDALLIINLLNSQGSQALNVSNSSFAQADYVDASGDNFLSPLDALVIINRLNGV